ncbi:hypothetical protein GJ496_009460 [Pomphorhynchus laevis]|nr:hypothetical protein GJ496_009460 [Pomphorhynchus laevis]
MQLARPLKSPVTIRHNDVHKQTCFSISAVLYHCKLILKNRIQPLTVSSHECCCATTDNLDFAGSNSTRLPEWIDNHTLLENRSDSNVFEVGRVLEVRGVTADYIRKRTVGIGMQLVPMDALFYYTPNKVWQGKISGLLFNLDLCRMPTVANLLEAYPIKDEPTLKIHKGTKPRKIPVEEDAYFCVEKASLTPTEVGDLSKHGKIAKYEMKFENTKANGRLFIIKPTGTAIMLSWGDAMYSTIGEWKMINNDAEMIRDYNGLSWLPNAYRMLQAKYNALIYYCCAEPMQLYRSVNHYIVKRKFPPGPIILFRHFHQKHDDLLTYETPLQDRNFFVSKTIEEAMIATPLKKFILVGSTRHDLDIFMELYRSYNKRIRHIYFYNSFNERKDNDRYGLISKVIDDNDRWTIFNTTKDLEKKIKDITIDDSIKEVEIEIDNIAENIKPKKPKSKLFFTLACTFAALGVIPLIVLVLYWAGMLDNLAGRQTYAQAAYQRISVTKDAFVRKSSMFIRHASRLISRDHDE